MPRDPVTGRFVSAGTEQETPENHTSPEAQEEITNKRISRSNVRYAEFMEKGIRKDQD